MDADKQRYDQYLDKLIPLLRDNGVIIVDNVGNYPQHMKPFLEQCTSRKDIIAQFLNMDFGLLFIVKNSSTNLLTKEKLAQYAQRV
jgi:predicted O-methyltransferase YrrM